MTYSILVEREEGGREREVRESREGGRDGCTGRLRLLGYMCM